MSRAFFLPGIRGNMFNDAPSRQAGNSWHLPLLSRSDSLACSPNRHLLLVNDCARRTAQLTLPTHLFLRTKPTCSRFNVAISTILPPSNGGRYAVLNHGLRRTPCKSRPSQRKGKKKEASGFCEGSAVFYVSDYRYSECSRYRFPIRRDK